MGQIYDETVNEEEFNIEWDCSAGWMQATHIPTGIQKRICINERSNCVNAARCLQYYMIMHMIPGR